MRSVTTWKVCELLNDFALPPPSALPWPRLSESLRHLELARQSNYADTWHWAMAGETFLGKLMMACAGLWKEGCGGKRGQATICTHLKTRRRAANEPQVVAMATNAKTGQANWRQAKKEAQLWKGGEREGGGKTPPLNILIKASSDSACKWPRQGRKWKQTAITKSKAAEGDKISRKGAALAYSKTTTTTIRQTEGCFDSAANNLLILKLLKNVGKSFESLLNSDERQWRKFMNIDR